MFTYQSHFNKARGKKRHQKSFQITLKNNQRSSRRTSRVQCPENQGQKVSQVLQYSRASPPFICIPKKQPVIVLAFFSCHVIVVAHTEFVFEYNSQVLASKIVI